VAVVALHTMTEATNEEDRVLVLDPEAGSVAERDAVRTQASKRGYEVVEPRPDGGVREVAEDAVLDGSDLVAAAGDDGTLHEVIRGIERSDGLDDVTTGVVPVGTETDFATNVGIGSVAEGLDVLSDGGRRTVDLGMAEDRPFVNSCIVGLTDDPDGELAAVDAEVGTPAYVAAALRKLPPVEDIDVRVDVVGADGVQELYADEAALVLVGNGRQFSPSAGPLGDMQDGEFHVTVVQDQEGVDLLKAGAIERLLAGDSAETFHCEAPSLVVSAGEDADRDLSFCLDGEVVHEWELSVYTRPKALRLAVSEEYDPTPGTAPAGGSPAS
jgi:diacylglycerol kinase family enzyme